VQNSLVRARVVLVPVLIFPRPAGAGQRVFAAAQLGTLAVRVRALVPLQHAARGHAPEAPLKQVDVVLVRLRKGEGWITTNTGLCYKASPPGTIKSGWWPVKICMTTCMLDD
jgi:hypothetical protein